MQPWDAATYGRRWADDYDDVHGVNLPAPYGQVDEQADLLAGLAGGGRALELGIGTGRIALPLKRRGVEVSGIDISEELVEHLAAKPGGDEIDVTIGDMADVAVEGTFALVYLVFNSLFALQTQEQQLRCLQNVADRLDDNGAFVVEAFVPDPAKLEPTRNRLRSVTVDRAEWDVATIDVAAQCITSQRIVITTDGTIDVRPLLLRYIWPAELDLMARIAGLRLRERWADWHKTPFGAGSAAHVSVYEPA